MTRVRKAFDDTTIGLVKRGAKAGGADSTSPRAKRLDAGRRSRPAAPERDSLRAGRHRPLIALFGSSEPISGDSLFDLSYRTGRILGQSGFDLMTGGYRGVMEAASRGAYDAGARVIGVTMKIFKDPPNPYLARVVRASNFYQRFRWLIDRADAYVALQGGMGTLAEVAFAWQEMATGVARRRPLVLMGAPWRAILSNWRVNLTARERVYAYLNVVDDPDEACAILCDFFFGMARRGARTREGLGMNPEGGRRQP